MRSRGVDCWGWDYMAHSGSNVPVPVSGITGAVSVSAGNHFNCALITGGTVQCWGDDGYGQLGDGSLVDSSVPKPVSGLTDAVSMSTGVMYDENCAARRSGAVACWGDNVHGQLGNGTTRSSTVPVAVRGINQAVAVAAGGVHACAVLAGGRVMCWGSNKVGQLGDGTRRSSSVPVAVSEITQATAVAVAARSYTCAVVRSGEVFCWGANPREQLGNGRSPRGSSTPVRAVGITNAVSVSTSFGHACALLSTGGADCWGYDDYGQLGNGGLRPPVRSPTPVKFPPAGS